VLRDGGKTLVLVVANGVAESREVQIGAESGSNVLVLSGVAAGDQLVANAAGVHAGQAVKVKTEEAKK
jgi:hypothetical protein